MDLFKDKEYNILLNKLKNRSYTVYDKEYINLFDKLMSIVNKYSEYKERKNNHYIQCCWSNDSCNTGPDTCICCYIGIELFEIGQLVDKLDV